MSDTPIDHTEGGINQQMQGHIHMHSLTRIYMDMPLVSKVMRDPNTVVFYIC